MNPQIHTVLRFWHGFEHASSKLREEAQKVQAFSRFSGRKMPFKDGRSSKQWCLDMDCGNRTSAVAALRHSGRADSSFAALCWLLWSQSGPNKIALYYLLAHN